MSITHLAIVSIPVSDQDRAKSFYVDTLGFDLISDNPMGPDQRWVQVGPKGAQTSLTLVTWFPTMPPGSVKGLVLECEDVRSTYDELSSRGVTFSSPIEEQFWGTFTTFDDPDGNGWVLQQRQTTEQANA
jgi:catechol 2,3-dioxygenase-like lactoylglutathione lyase family enzyme